MMRGMIVWGVWIVVAAALAAPQRVFGDTAPSLNGDVPPAQADTPEDPVIEEPIRPLFPVGTETIPTARQCGTAEVLMMSAGALFLLMFNLTSNFSRAQRES